MNESTRASLEQLSAVSRDVGEIASRGVQRMQLLEQAQEQLQAQVTAFSQVATGATEQANSTTAALSAVQSTVGDGQRARDDADELQRWLQESTSNLRSGRAAVQKVLSSVQDLAGALEAVTAHLDTLRSAADGIDDISASILDIAGQTNLLSLNATIEAARAGEHGKGFAVVAEAVRRLSDQSRDKVRETEDRVRAINAAIDGMTGLSSGLSETARSVSAETQGAESALSQMVEVLDSGTGRLGTILQTFSAITSQMETVSQELGNVAAVSEENAAIVEEVTASATAVHTQIEQIASLTRLDAEGTRATAARVKDIEGRVGGVTTSSSILRMLSNDIAADLAGDKGRSHFQALVASAREKAARLAKIAEEVPLEELGQAGYVELRGQEGLRTLSRLFDTSRAHSVDPPKFRLSWDAKVDERLCRELDSIAREEPATAYTGLFDLNGFFLAGDRSTRADLTGDAQTDQRQSRIKRLMEDPYTLAVCRLPLTQIGQLQPHREDPRVLWEYTDTGVATKFHISTYARDTGETLAEIVVPVLVHNRPLGVLRWTLRADDSGNLVQLA